jgi:hypothetical protein
MEMQQDERLDVSPPPQARPRRRRLAGALGVTLVIALTLGVSAAAAESPSPVTTTTTSITVGAGPAAGVSSEGPSAADAAKLDAAFAEYRVCMREHGVDLPEPVVVQSGQAVPDQEPVSLIGPVSGSAPLPAIDAEAFGSADTACSPILEAAGIRMLSTSSGGDAEAGSVPGSSGGVIGGGVIGGAAVLGGVAGADDVEAMVAPVRTYAACMREHGVDVPDPVVDEGAGTFELKLDVDPTTPDFRAADAACSDGSGFGFAVPVAPVGP